MRVVLGRRVPCTWLLLFAPPWLKYSPRRGETGTLQGYLQLNPPTELLILVVIICISRKSDICMFPWFLLKLGYLSLLFTLCLLLSIGWFPSTIYID